MNCPRCSAAVATDAKFCANCGAPLARSRAAEGERRVVTVLFCDVKGSTALAESLDPEEWTEIMNGAFAALVEPVSRYGGTVIRLLGDALLAFFGAPLAHEDDPERAVLAAIEMVAQLRDYRDRLRTERGISEFDIRIGINTGLAVLGDVGSGQRVEYTAMGDAVNVAARLQQAATPGTSVIGETTQKLVRDLFELRPLGALDVRGRRAPVEAFEVLGRAVAAPREREVPFVGRAKELAALREAVEAVRAGQGQILAVIGEGGIGKSRLMNEVHAESAEAAARHEQWSIGRAQSYGQSQAFHVFRQHVLNVIEANETDPPDVVRERIARELRDEPAESRDRAIRSLELFLGVQREGDTSIELEGEALRAELVRVISLLIRRFVTGAPGVLAFDDLHWSDPASTDLLAELFALTDEVPVLFLCSFRPDRQSVAWRVKQRAETDYPHRYTETVLRPLDEEEAAALLRHLLEGAELPAWLAARVLDKAEGIPLFLEEIVRALIDDGIVARDPEVGWFVTRDTAAIRLPETIQGLVASRIDRLEEDARQTLQAAAVIGRTFHYRVLRAVAETDGKLDRHLVTLQRLELVREQARDPEREYTFRHPLTQEAAYSSILQRRRRELHARVAQALEVLFPDRMEEYAGLVGHHYAEAGDARAVPYLKSAGDRAMRLYALDESLAHYRRAIGLAQHDPQDASVVTELYGNCGRVLELQGAYEESVPLYEELERLGIERGDAAMEGAALAHLITVFTNPTAVQDPRRARELLHRSIAIARAHGDKKLLSSLLWNAGNLGFWLGDPGTLALAEESLAIARELDDREQAAFTLNTIGQITRELGDMDRADAALTEALELFRERGNKPMVADCLSTLAITALSRGEYTRVQPRSDEAYRICDEIDNAWGRSYARFGVCYARWEMAEYAEAIAAFDECVGWAEKGGFVAAQVGPGSDLGWLYVTIGAVEKGVAALEHARQRADLKLGEWRAWPLVQLSRVAILRGELRDARALLEEAGPMSSTFGKLFMPTFHALARVELALAEERFDEAIALAREGEEVVRMRTLPPFLFDLVWLEGEALRSLRRLDAAAAAFARGRASAERIGARRVLWRILASQAALHRERGDLAAAQSALDAARSIVDAISESLEPLGLAEPFLALPYVRELELVAR